MHFAATRLESLFFQHVARLFSVAPPDFGCEIFLSLMHVLLVRCFSLGEGEGG